MTRLLYSAFQLENLANGGLESASQILERVGRNATVLTQRETSFNERWRAAGCEVIVCSDAGPARVRVPRFNAKARELIRQGSIRVAHCNDIAALWHVAPAARLAGAAVIFNVRDIFDEGRAYGPKWRLVHHVANEIVCLSEEMRETVMRRFPPHIRAFPRAVVSVTPSAIDLERMRPVGAEEKAALRKQLGMSASTFEIVYVGAVCPKKNQFAFLTEAAPQLLRAVPEARVTFAGDFRPDSDAYARSCADAVTHLALGDRVSFHGYVTGTQRYYQAADVTCLASRYEGLPRGMIESMACGTPVVAFDVTSAREYLEQTGAGLVASRYDFATLVRHLDRLSKDRALLTQLRTASRAVAERSFDPEKSVAAYRRRYEHWAANAARA